MSNDSHAMIITNSNHEHQFIQLIKQIFEIPFASSSSSFASPFFANSKNPNNKKNMIINQIVDIEHWNFIFHIKKVVVENLLLSVLYGRNYAQLHCFVFYCNFFSFFVSPLLHHKQKQLLILKCITI